MCPWKNDSIALRCVLKLSGVPPHSVQLATLDQIKIIVSEIQPARSVRRCRRNVV